MFGHTGKEGIRVAGETVTLKGAAGKPIAVLRTGNDAAVGTDEGGAVAALFDARIDVMEHINAAASDGAKAYAIADSAHVGSQVECKTVTDLAQMFSGTQLGGKATASAINWLSPTQAWAQAQAKQQAMLLFFYSPKVAEAEKMNMLIEAGSDAKSLLSKYACSKVDVSQIDGDVIAKKYEIYKVPTLLLIQPDAKSFKKLMPSPSEPWQQIQVQLTAK